MLRGTKLLTVTGLCGILGACQALDPASMDDLDYKAWDLEAVRNMVPQGSAFSQGLRAGYLNEADLENEAGDWGDYDHYARKAVTAAKGLNVQPDMVSLRTLSPEEVDEMTAARARLMAGLDGDGRRKAPLALARAQVAYDCWLEQLEENDEDDIARCKSAFERQWARWRRLSRPT